MFCKVNYVNFTIGVESTQHFVEAMPFRTSPHKKTPHVMYHEAGHPRRFQNFQSSPLELEKLRGKYGFEVFEKFHSERSEISKILSILIDGSEIPFPTTTVLEDVKTKNTWQLMVRR